MKKKIITFLIGFFSILCLFSLVFLFTADASQVNCVLQSPGMYNCQITTYFLGKVRLFQRNINNVTGARVEEGQGNNGIVYKAVLTTADGGSVGLTGDSDSDYNTVYKEIGPILSQMTAGATQITYTNGVIW